MGLGNWTQNPITNQEKEKAYKAIDAALANGIRVFDHANIYTFGKAESIFGMYLQDNPGTREKIKINSKAGILLHSGLSNSNTYNNSANYLIEELKKSIDRLQIDYLDSFLIHRYDPLTTTKNIAETLDQIVETGLAKSVGLSNVPPKTMLKIANQSKHKPVNCQVQFSLGHSNLIKGNTFFNLIKPDTNYATLEDYESLGLEIQIWGPLDKGLYLKKQNTNAQIANTHMLVKEMANRYGVSAEAVVLAWINKLPFNLAPIIGTTQPERIKNCCQKVELSREDWYNLWISTLQEPLP